jgi:hypothetical protein
MSAPDRSLEKQTERPAESPVNEENRLKHQDYAWNYFALHADQRLKTFNFYLILVAVVLGGLLTFLKDAKDPRLGLPAGLLLVVLSYVFYRLYGRNRELINHAQEVLKVTEERLPKELQLFTGEETKTGERRRTQGKPTWWNPVSWVFGHYTYRDSLNVVFLCISLLGLAITVGVFFLPGSQTPPAPMPPTQNFYIGAQPVNPNPTDKLGAAPIIRSPSSAPPGRAGWRRPRPSAGPC